MLYYYQSLRLLVSEGMLLRIRTKDVDVHYLDCYPKSWQQEICHVGGVYLCCWEVYPQHGGNPRQSGSRRLRSE